MAELTETRLEYAAGEKKYVGLLLKNDGAPRFAFVLLPDWRGQSALARAHAKHLVEHGGAVAIADLYGNGFSPTDPDQVGPMVKRLMEHREDGVKALAACVEALRSKVGAETPLFVLGYSAGGMVTLDYGRSGAKIAGLVVCSGLLKTAAPNMATKIESPVLLLQGTQDVVSPMDVVLALVKEMDDAKNDFRLELFGQTHHAFDNPEAGTDPNARLVYSAQSAARAKKAILEFVDAALASC